MTVLLVLFTFATFLLIDHFRSRHPVEATLQADVRKQEAAPRLQPALVTGFEVPENVRYHPGHTWALSESPNLVRVRMDDFASCGKRSRSENGRGRDSRTETIVSARDLLDLRKMRGVRRGSGPPPEAFKAQDRRGKRLPVSKEPFGCRKPSCF
jgi:hypothetical protein